MSKFKNTPIIALIKGVLISYAITMAVFIIYAALITYTDLTEEYVSPLALVVTAVSCLVCGFATAKSAKSRGLLWGIASGGLYMAIMFSLGYATMPSYELNQKLLISLALALIGGGVGGVFGVNR